MSMPLLIRLWRGRQSGQALVWTAVMMPLFLSMIGLTIDAGQVFDGRRQLQNLADAAARAGATQIDQQAYRASNGSSVVLDTGKARQAAADYVSRQSADVQGTVSADPALVTVQLNRDMPTSFLRIVNIDKFKVGATAVAALDYGIDRGNRA